MINYMLCGKPEILPVGSPGAPAEPSEEVRLALARLAAEPALAHGGAGLAATARNLAAALRHALADPCPDIIKVGLSNLSAHVGPGCRAAPCMS